METESLLFVWVTGVGFVLFVMYAIYVITTLVDQSKTIAKLNKRVQSYERDLALLNHQHKANVRLMQKRIQQLKYYNDVNLTMHLRNLIQQNPVFRIEAKPVQTFLDHVKVASPSRSNVELDTVRDELIEQLK